MRIVAVCTACALGGMVAVAAAACGPSFQAVYECDVRFEHCYALDEGPASDDAKKDCWREWLRGYTYGQSRDRIEYGGTRLSQLSLDPTLPSEDVRPEIHKHAVAAPMPTNAFAPLPNLAEGQKADGPSAADAVVVHAPGADCADTCKERWTSCRIGCRDGTCTPCDEAYRTCMPDCFRQEPLPEHHAAPASSAPSASAKTATKKAL